MFVPTVRNAWETHAVLKAFVSVPTISLPSGKSVTPVKVIIPALCILIYCFAIQLLFAYSFVAYYLEVSPSFPCVESMGMRCLRGSKCLDGICQCPEGTVLRNGTCYTRAAFQQPKSITSTTPESTTTETTTSSLLSTIQKTTTTLAPSTSSIESASANLFKSNLTLTGTLEVWNPEVLIAHSFATHSQNQHPSTMCQVLLSLHLLLIA